MIDIDDLLKVDDKLEEIRYPTRNQRIIQENPRGTYIFQNNEKFKGRLKDNKLSLGIYKWPNGQQYLGDLSDNNNFSKRGTIIFPNDNKLIGNFIMKENKIKSAVYEKSGIKIIGTFVNNKLEGKVIIKSKENEDHFSFQGMYHNGKRHGNFTLEKVIYNRLLIITGTFKEGKKNGLFRVIKKKSENDKKLIYEKRFLNDLPMIEVDDEEKIENKRIILEYKSPYNIHCLKVIKKEQDKIYILLGTYEYLLIINLINNKIPNKYLIFKKADINDILQTKDGKFLLCSSENEFKLIDSFSFEEEIYEIESQSPTIDSLNDIKILQVFKGLKNSKSIFVMKELSNGVIASGDCENIIFWEKSDFLEYKNINYIKLTKTYCILEIKSFNNENDDKIILAVAQPDSQCILFINYFNNKFNLKKKIDNIYTIHNRKNIMKQFINKDKNILLIGCENHLVTINLNNYTIFSKIFYEKISYINMFLNRFILCGIMKNKNMYNYEGYLSQILVQEDKKGNNNIINISKCLNHKHEGSIIDGDIIIYEEKEAIITIGNDDKILILH